MWSAIKFQWQVRKLNRQRDRVEEIYQEKRKALKSGGQPISNFSAEEWSDQSIINAEIYKLETTYLLRRAAREKVPTPDNEDEDAWHEAIGGGYFLSTTAYANLRGAIRKERNEKWEFRFKVLGFLATSAIGLVGALIGLVSALKK
jgi:hypothetical protein